MSLLDKEHNIIPDVKPEREGLKREACADQIFLPPKVNRSGEQQQQLATRAAVDGFVASTSSSAAYHQYSYERVPTKGAL